MGVYWGSAKWTAHADPTDGIQGPSDRLRMLGRSLETHLEGCSSHFHKRSMW